MWEVKFDSENDRVEVTDGANKVTIEISMGTVRQAEVHVWNERVGKGPVPEVHTYGPMMVVPEDDRAIVAGIDAIIEQVG